MPTDRRQGISPAFLAALFVGVVTLFVGWKVLGFGFVSFDDDRNITLNPNLGPPSLHTLHWMLTDWTYMRRYVPLGWLGFSSVYGLCGLTAAGYHAAALLVHAANAVLAFAALDRLLERWRPARSTGWRTTCAAIGALAWSLHPLRAETAGWCSGLLYAQSTFLALLALHARLRGRLLGSAAFFLLSLLTYPVSLGWLAVLVLVGGRPAGGRRRLLLEGAVLALPPLAVGLFTTIAEFHSQGIWNRPPALADFSVTARIMQGGYVWIHFLRATLWPTHLTPEPTALVQFNPWSPLFVGSACAVAALSAALLVMRRCLGWGPLLLWVVYVAVLAPMSGFALHPYFACDRYSYLPSLILSAALAAGLYGWIDGAASRRAATGVCALALAVLGLGFSRQLEIWRNDDSLFARLAAEAAYRPVHVTILCRQARAAAAAGNAAKAEAILAAGERAFPGLGDFRDTRGDIRADQAWADSLDPQARAITVLGAMHLEMAVQDARQGQTPEARTLFECALQDCPRSGAVLYDSAVFEASQGRPREALHHCLSCDTTGRLPPERRARLIAYVAGALRAAGQDRSAQLLEGRPPPR